jgi:GNAT superfamily N-acetyltransferase
LLRSLVVTPRRVDPVTEPATLDAMDAVMQQAYGVSSFRAGIDRFVAVQPDGLAVVEHDGSVVGTGCCIAYPDAGFGWVGLVATAHAWQRHGIATAITELLGSTLAGHGCAAVLDASIAGGPVYERMGFVDCGVTRVLGLAGDGEPMAPSAETCERFTPDDLDDVVAFDAVRFGASRRRLLAKVIDQHPGRTLVLRRRRLVVGYLVAQQSALAPVVADDAEALSALVTASRRLAWDSPPRINLPPESSHLATLLRLGFEPRRELRHMRRGIETLPGRRECVAGLVSLGEG